MEKQTLREFCNGKTQRQVAEAIGRSQGAISQMLKANREIYVITDDDGGISWYEKKVFSSGSRAA